MEYSPLYLAHDESIASSYCLAICSLFSEQQLPQPFVELINSVLIVLSKHLNSSRACLLGTMALDRFLNSSEAHIKMLHEGCSIVNIVLKVIERQGRLRDVVSMLLLKHGSLMLFILLSLLIGSICYWSVKDIKYVSKRSS